MTRRVLIGALLVLAATAILALAVGYFRNSMASRENEYVLRIALPAMHDEVGLPQVQGPIDSSRPLVVLDPGHGGYDPGAGRGAVREKNITLQLARQIREELLRTGGIRVALTRDEDRYLMLSERSSIAQRLGADVFLSIHADSTDNKNATGASVYVLSEKGSSQAAAMIAAKENSADQIAGVRLAFRDSSVGAILLDLSQREAQAGSDELARLLLREVKGKVPLHRDTVQSAAFEVLKSPDVPSILFETGFVSNTGDAAYLLSRKGRSVIAQSTATAIRAYFARQAVPTNAP